MEARGLPSWRGARDDLVAQRDNPEWDVWVLDDEATGVIGQTVVQRQGRRGVDGRGACGAGSLVGVGHGSSL
jgi:hypothetical protein